MGTASSSLPSRTERFERRYGICSPVLGARVVAEPVTLDDSIRWLTTHAAFALVLGAVLIEHDNVSGLEDVRAAAPRIRLIVTSRHDHPAYAASVMCHGADHHVRSHHALGELPVALQSSRSGPRDVAGD
jgi:DNA-binding NarL/FixJ family response regulator